MKLVIAFFVAFLGLAAVASLLLVDQAAPTRAFVSDLVGEDIKDETRRRAEDAVAAIRDLTRRSSADPVEIAIAPEATVEAAPPAVADAVDDDPAAPPVLVSAAAPSYEIGATGGIGVSYRSDCADDARVEGGLQEGDAVTVVTRGAEACTGWTLVTDVATLDRTWVRDRHLVVRSEASSAPSSPSPAPAKRTTPQPAAPATPADSGGPAAPATPATPAVPPTPTPADAQAVWFGDIEGQPGDIVSAWINGTECAAAVAYDRDGQAFYYLPVPTGASCGPTPGATVTFRVAGTVASAASTWTAGGSTQLSLAP